MIGRGTARQCGKSRAIEADRVFTVLFLMKGRMSFRSLNLGCTLLQAHNVAVFLLVFAFFSPACSDLTLADHDIAE
jgi:hypothetical protein